VGFLAHGLIIAHEYAIVSVAGLSKLKDNITVAVDAYQGDMIIRYSQYCNFYNKADKQSIFVPKTQSITPSQVSFVLIINPNNAFETTDSPC